MKPNELLELYSEAFKSIVDSDIRGTCDQETVDSLRHPDVVRKWHTCLVGIKRSIETQLATFKIEKVQKASNPDYESWCADRNKWKLGALRFKASVEEKIAESKGFLRSEVTEADQLRAAIIDHKINCLENPDDIDQWDDKLWNQV